MMTKFADKKYKNFCIVFFIALFCAAVFLFFSKCNFEKNLYNFKEFIAQTEAKTFDIRQKVLSKDRKPPEDIVIVGVDNLSHEFLTSHFGSWPMPRGVYADFIDYMENQQPAAIGIDVLFVGAWHKNKQDDIRLAETFGKYDNLFGAIYFDDYSRQERQPLVLPESAKAECDFNKTITPYYYNNLRELYPEFLQYAKNLGHLNLERSKDGVIRTLPLIVRYKNNPAVSEPDYYANFALKIFTKYIENKENVKIEKYKTDKQNNLLINTKKLPVLYSTEAVLNWYNTDSLKRNSTFNYVSFKDVFLSMEALKNNEKPVLAPDYFKDKIVLLGFNADSLADLKTVPVAKLIPGVEIYATFLGNAIDNSLIKKTDKAYSLVISAILFLLTMLLVFRIKSSLINIISVISLGIVYIWLCFAAMKMFYLWLPIVIPIISIFIAYSVTIAIKYFFKSVDYEQMYKLAIYDALTGLYNHRFFQDQMRINYETCKRYGGNFSLIIIDIDKFKNFNDTYGHQVGDAVLRQVSQLLKSSLRKPDIICRYGGEEITIILPNTSNKNAHALAEKLCKSVASHDFQVTKDLTVNVTISLGVSTYPDSAKTIEDIIKAADKILYNAKETGRNKVGDPNVLTQ